MLTRLQVVWLGARLSFLIPEVETCTISSFYYASQGQGVLRVPEVHHHVVVFLSAFFNLACDDPEPPRTANRISKLLRLGHLAKKAQY
jgi:hypothetical protein